jgi:sulfotransferase
MGKSYHFLAGMHRSGNTLLASIINQNKECYASPVSPLVEYMWRCHADDFQAGQTNPRISSKNNMISNMIKNYYEDINSPIILDRAKSWASPDNIKMIKKYVTDFPKIIFTVRPIDHVICSLIKTQKKDYLKDMRSVRYPINNKISTNDNIAEYIFSTEGPYFISYYGYESINSPDNQGMIHVVRYEDLCFNPEETMNGIYDFLEIDRYSHNFDNIFRTEEELDIAAGLPEDLHVIRKELSASTTKPEDYLSKNMIAKCKEMDLFYN